MTTSGEPAASVAAWTQGPLQEERSEFGALLRGVRAGRNTTFDRLVFDFDGPAPGYRVEYVDELAQDGSGNPVPLRGRAVVQILLRPAAAHGDDGRPTFSGPPPQVSDCAAFRQVADAGDFEGQLTWGIGVAGRLRLRAVILSEPSRVAVDVAHAEPGSGNELLRRGSVGASVATWQWRIVQALSRELAVDEHFGPATEAATRDFQRSVGLTADGVVGPRSRAAMEQRLGL